MAEKPTQQRRLVAILAADVVGYSRLMEQDEAGTIAVLAERREGILEPLLAKYHGRVVRLMGDGTLAEFSSAVDAVRCAVEIQKEMKEANGKSSNERAIVLRIGINLGDVIVHDGDLYGDGVNIAARLEAMADPGGICLSAAMHQQVERLLPFVFRDLGDQTLKNIARPVRAYSVVGVEAATDRMSMPTDHASSPLSKPSIAVLPFTNMTGDPGQQYFSDGITEDIITELSRFRSLFVIARNSSFQFRGKSTDVRRIARELSVQYLVEGSVRRAGRLLRITAQLVDATTGNHLWAERYERSLEDVFLVQDEVVRTIVGTLEHRLATRIAEQARRKPTRSVAAYECVLQAREHMATFDATAAEPLLRRAIELDPDYAQAHAWLASVHTVNFFFDPRSERADVALRCAKKAVALDEGDAMCHVVLGNAYLFCRQFELAGLHCESRRSRSMSCPVGANGRSASASCRGAADATQLHDKLANA